MFDSKLALYQIISANPGASPRVHRRTFLRTLGRKCSHYPPLSPDPNLESKLMARPRLHDEPRVSTAIRLPESLHQRLRDAALDRDVSVNLLATKAIGQFLDSLLPADEILKPVSVVPEVSTVAPTKVEARRAS